jgi:enterochelin esterase family protein
MKTKFHLMIFSPPRSRPCRRKITRRSPFPRYFRPEFLAVTLCLVVGAALASEPAATDAPTAAESFASPRLEKHRVPSPRFKTPKPLVVYLPPEYDPTPAEPYPVLYFLHGLGNSPEDFESRGAAALTDRLIRTGKLAPVIIALPTGAVSYYVNRIDGGAPYEDHVRLEVPAYVEAHYPVRTDPAGRALAGISMGGYGALKIAMRYPSEFGSASAHTPFLMKDIPLGEGTDRTSRMFMSVMHTLYGDPIDPGMWEANNPFALAAQPDARFPPLLFSAASEDRYGLQIPAKRFHEELNALEVPHIYLPFEGVHGWLSFETHWERILRFHSGVWLRTLDP